MRSLPLYFMIVILTMIYKNMAAKVIKNENILVNRSTFLGNLLVTCRIIAIFLFFLEKMISFANYYIVFK